MCRPAIVAWLLCAMSPATLAGWIEFADQTASRISAPPELTTTDPREKDFAWGDVDNDGDIDLVIVRKEPFTTAGKEPNVLLLNDNGVLTDRTAEFASASDVPGNLGFLTPTNDRDVALVDVDLDGWLDIVTATTTSDGDPKWLGQPRIYINLGCTGACEGTGDWLGFRHEDARMPLLISLSGMPGFNPRFASVVVGDLTGDGYPELWFGDYDSSGAGGDTMPPAADFDDRLLVNQGLANPGHFTDETSTRFPGLIAVPGAGSQPFPESNFSATGAIADINGDDVNDIVKQTALSNPAFVGIAYNNANSDALFTQYDVVNQLGPYAVSHADLNNDDLLDLVIADHGADRYLLNQGVGADGKSDFLSFVFSFLHEGAGPPASDDGFPGNTRTADLDRDGWEDVLITDVEADIAGCDRRAHIYRNLGGRRAATSRCARRRRAAVAPISSAIRQVASLRAFPRANSKARTTSPSSTSTATIGRTWSSAGVPAPRSGSISRTPRPAPFPTGMQPAARCCGCASSAARSA